MNGASNKIVSVIVVSCGIKDYLGPCLDSLRTQAIPPLEVIVIDNSLNHDFAQLILKNYPWVKLCSGPRSLSYCEAVNKGVEMSAGDFVLCLNDDVVLESRFIKEALRGFLIDRKVGMVSGKILRYDKKTIDTTGLFLSLWRSAKERGYGRKDGGQFQKEGYIFGVNGAVAFYRRAMLESVKEESGYFDADFHFFYEDLDLAWRAKRNGWRGYYIPGALAYHVRGGTLRSTRGINRPYARRYLSDNLQADLIKNRYLTVIKNERWLDFLAHAPFMILYDLAAWTYILFFRPRQIKIFISNLEYLNSSFRKRRQTGKK